MTTPMRVFVAVLLLLSAAVQPISARPVYGLQSRGMGGSKETRSARKARLIDIVTAGEASAALVTQEEEVVQAEEGADTAGDPTKGDDGGEEGESVEAVEPATEDGSATTGKDVEAPKRASVGSRLTGYLSSVYRAGKSSRYTKQASKTASFFANKYLRKDKDAPAEADIEAEPRAEDAPLPDDESAATPASMSDEELSAVLAQADEAEANGINFIKPASGAFRDATIRPSSPPPALAPLSYEHLRQHYITEVEPVKPEKCEPSAVKGGREAQCAHVTATASCGGKLVHYLRFVYCNPLGTAFPVALITLSLIVMLYILATIADTFFCPALETVSTLMKLSPDVAGATLLALGNGAPDIFSQVAAVTSGDLPDVNLAVSSALGSGLFITTVILGAVVLQSSTKVIVKPYAYQRDSLAYLGSVVLVAAVLLGGTVALWHTTALAMFYSIYICVVIFGGDSEGNKNSGGKDGGGRGEAGSKTKSEPLFDLASQKGGPDDIKGTHLSRPPRPINLAVLDKAKAGAINWILDEVRWEEKGPLERIISPITIPIQLAMTLTMPIVREGNLTKGYTTALSFFAPLFFLSTPGTVPLLAALLPGSPWMYILACAALTCSMTAMMLSFEKHGPAAASEVCAALTFVQSVVWMHLAADELVLCIDALGKVAGISEDFLGATVLAWGNCVGDLMSNLAVARAGQAPMAVAACFAGPLFNLLVGLAASLVYVNIVIGDIKAETSNSMLLLVAGSFVALVACVVVVRSNGAWELSKPFGWALLGGYAVFTAVYSLTEIGVLFAAPWFGGGSARGL